MEATFSERLGENFRSLEEGFADEESGFHDDILESGWIQIGIGSSNNTAADLKSCQNSSYKRCIGVLRKNFPNLLQGDKPQEVTVSVQGSGTESKFSEIRNFQEEIGKFCRGNFIILSFFLFKNRFYKFLLEQIIGKEGSLKVDGPIVNWTLI